MGRSSRIKKLTYSLPGQSKSSTHAMPHAERNLEGAERNVGAYGTRLRRLQAYNFDEQTSLSRFPYFFFRFGTEIEMPSSLRTIDE